MTDYTPRIAGLTAWKNRRRLRKAARLLHRGAISKLDFSLVAADIVSRLQHGRPIEFKDRLNIGTFGSEGLCAVDVPVKDWETQKAMQYGPLADVPTTLADRFPVYEGEGDFTDRRTLDFSWGTQCADLLWRAQMRLRLWWRLVERYDRWKTRQKEFAPAAHSDLWRLLIFIFSLVTGYVLGRLGIP